MNTTQGASAELWHYPTMGLPNEEITEMWRASGHSGTVPFSFANRIQERLQAALAASPQVEVAPQAEQVAKAEPFNVNLVHSMARKFAIVTTGPAGETFRFADEALVRYVEDIAAFMQAQRDHDSDMDSTERAAAPADDSLTLDEIEALRLALNWLGESTYETLEECAIYQRRLVRRLIRAVVATRTAEGADKRDAEGGAA